MGGKKKKKALSGASAEGGATLAKGLHSPLFAALVRQERAIPKEKGVCGAVPSLVRHHLFRQVVPSYKLVTHIRLPSPPFRRCSCPP
mmetsp:Transcript_17139/g.56079  ORF Transcript_17139/g.56079 Transcript_17139/m.56079 type:complete len:87 (-) Transcript_17139:669-929(-)